MQVTLFGAMGLRHDAGEVVIRGAIPRAIVARLALSAGVAIDPDELIADLWPEPPGSALSSLRAHISRLRSGTLGPTLGPVLGHGRSGYRLDIDRSDVDVLHYRDLLGADPAAWARTVDEAEPLWRGEPLETVAEWPFASAFAGELWMLRADASAERAALHLDRGENEAAAALLADVLRHFPERELLVERRAIALARAGRIGDALDVIDDALARPGFRRASVDPAGQALPSALAGLRQAIQTNNPVVLGRPGEAGSATERIGIPVPLTSFVGRERELGVIERGREQSRLVSLVGPAGVGKTRLAVEAARSSGADDVQWMLDLALVPSPGAVLPALSILVGATSASVDAVAERLTGRRSLLVLDNVEHVLGVVAALVAELLARCEGLSVLVTSREALRMPGERLVHVDPFLGADAHDGIALFLERVAGTRGDDDLQPQERRYVDELCRAVDGIPLALELAASRLDVMSVPELLESIRATHGATLQRAGGGRHGSLQGAIEWSLSLLGEAESRLLGELALFAGPFDAETVVAVCGGGAGAAGDAGAEGAAGGAGAVRGLLVSLVRKSLVATSADEVGLRHYQLLESVKAVVLARDVGATSDGATTDGVTTDGVTADGATLDTDAWYDRHAAWMLQRAEVLAEDILSVEAPRARAMFGAMALDLRLALQRAHERGDRELAVRLVGAQAWYWFERGSLGSALASIRSALELPGETVPAAEAEALLAASFISAVTAPLERTGEWVDRFRAAALAMGDTGYRALGETLRANLDAESGRVDEALAGLARAERLLGEAGETVPEWLRCDELLVRGETLRVLGRPHRALTLLNESHARAVRIGYAWAARGTSHAIGKTLIEVNRAREALDVLLAGAVRSTEFEDWSSALSMLNVAAAALSRLELPREAARLFGAVDQLGQRHGYEPLLADAGYGVVHRDRVRLALVSDEWVAEHAAGARFTMSDALRFVAAQREGARQAP